MPTEADKTTTAAAVPVLPATPNKMNARSNVARLKLVGFGIAALVSLLPHIQAAYPKSFGLGLGIMWVGLFWDSMMKDADKNAVKDVNFTPAPEIK